ncbi:unnamed protein product [Ilex paraguariensis]|uniref:Uncharacterized protein n=1 Tax=Ilex paraguariensis TaxID=185542 RepID=A0ABC8UCJ3_9AQUA
MVEFIVKAMEVGLTEVKILDDVCKCKKLNDLAPTSPNKVLSNKSRTKGLSRNLARKEFQFELEGKDGSSTTMFYSLLRVMARKVRIVLLANGFLIGCGLLKMRLVELS